MTSTVGDQVYARVTALVNAGAGMSRAQAIRAVAEEMGRSVPGTSSAFYAGARRARDAGGSPADGGRHRHIVAHADESRLYAEMLPLVEAGASVEQAARRFGDEDDVQEIAAGFSRWVAGDAEARITSLEAENRTLRRDLTRTREALQRARAILDTVAGAS